MYTYNLCISYYIMSIFYIDKKIFFVNQRSSPDHIMLKMTAFISLSRIFKRFLIFYLFLPDFVFYFPIHAQRFLLCKRTKAISPFTIKKKKISCLSIFYVTIFPDNSLINEVVRCCFILFILRTNEESSAVPRSLKCSCAKWDPKLKSHN